MVSPSRPTARHPRPAAALLAAALLAAGLALAVRPLSAHAADGFATENVFIVVIDGIRLSEGMGDPEKTWVPEMATRLAPLGVVNHRFRNAGHTKTVSGHASILTGTRQRLENVYFSKPHPDRPTLFEYWRRQKDRPESDALIATSKRKLAGLAYSEDDDYGKRFRAATEAPGGGAPVFLRIFSAGYRDDLDTFDKLSEAMERDHPRVVMVNLREPDTEAHDGHWDGYLEAIARADAIVGRLWDRLQADPFYAGKTTLIVTNDHGRHLDTEGGFEDHGDSCEGCQRVMFLALGPDFAPGREIETPRSLIDLLPTVAVMLGIDAAEAEGEVMHELFRSPGTDARMTPAEPPPLVDGAAVARPLPGVPLIGAGRR